MTTVGWLAVLVVTALVIPLVMFYQGVLLGVQHGLETGLNAGVAYGKISGEMDEVVGRGGIKLTVETWGASVTYTAKELPSQRRFEVIRGGKT